MALTTAQQLTDLVDRSSVVLLAVRKEWKIDDVAAALAIKALIEKRGRKADIAIEGFKANDAIASLPSVAAIRDHVSDLQRFVITLDVARTKVDEIFYDMSGDKLRIHVTPKDGRFESRDLHAEAADFKYDLIITFGTPDLKSLGKIHASNPEFFFSCPVINIDHDAANERYGSVNIVDITASSTSEVVGLLLRDIDKVISETTATALLTGIIAATRSFRTGSITPRTLDFAAELMAAGAKREEIIQRLYRNRDVATLKLWGRAMARLKHDADIKLAWTVLVRQDFIHAGASDEQLSSVLEDLVLSSPEADAAAVIFEHDSNGQTEIRALLATDKHMDAADLVRPLNPEGTNRSVRLSFPGTDMIEAEKKLVETIRKAIKNRGLK